MSLQSTSPNCIHLPYWFRYLLLKITSSLLIASFITAPLASLASANSASFGVGSSVFAPVPQDQGGLTEMTLPTTPEAEPDPTPTPEPTAVADTSTSTDIQNEEEGSAELNPLELVFDTQKIKAKLDPAIYIADKPFTLSWYLPDWYEQEPGETRHMVLTLPEALDATSKLSEKELNIPVTSASGSTTFTLPKSVVQTLGDVVIGLQLFENDEPVGSITVIVGLPAATLDNAKTASFQALNNRVNISLPALAVNANLAVDIRHPDENSLPSLSLTGRPVEILAVDTVTAKNVTYFKKPITVEMVYDEAEIWDWQEDELKIFYFDEEMGDWRPLPTTVDPNTNTLSAQTDHLTVFDYKAETWQAASLPTIDSFQVSDFTGAGTYSIPFWTPPGPGGLQPSVSLSYNSQVIDNSSLYTQASWVGAGWSLDTGSIVRIMHDSDDDTTDDTFVLSVAGISSTLLPVSESGTVTTYRTSEESFNKIEYDSSTETWTVITTSGTEYEFADTAETHTTNGCAATSGDLNIIWRWSLSLTTDIHGNELDYTYHVETKSGCANEVAVYPEYITYPHDLYRVHFVREDRDDFKSAWEDSTSEVLYGTERLQEVRIEHDPNGTSSWATIRQYEFTYSANVLNQIYPAFEWSEGGKTLTLIEVQEKNGDGTDSLPATTFYYEDDMHLTKVENGLGGNVTLEYERWTYFDDVNDDLRSMLIIFGEDQCDYSGSNLTSWTDGPPYYGPVNCTDTDKLRIGNQVEGSNAEVGTGLHSIPEYLTHPGGIYQFYLNVTATYGSTDIIWGFIKQDSPPYSFDYESASNVGEGSYIDLQEAFEIPASYDPADTKLRIDCEDCKFQKMQFALQPLFFRVKTKTIDDMVTGRQTAYIYQYDNPAPNDATRSEAVDEAGTSIEDLYNYPNREYRGNAMAQVVDANHLAQTTWYYQNDYYRGKPYKTLTLRQDLWDPFDALDTDDWTTAASGTYSITHTYEVDYDDHLRMTNTGTNWDVYVDRAAYSLSNGEVAIAHIRLNDTDSRGQIGLDGYGSDYFGLKISSSAGNYSAQVQYDTGTGMQTGSTLISAGDFELGSWYGVMFFVDSDDGYGVRIWQLDDPETTMEATVTGMSSYAWRFEAGVYDGKLDLDAYQEGKVYAESNTAYDYDILYDTDSTNGITDLSDSNLLDYIDLNVFSTEVTETSNRTYEGDYAWTGTETRYTYDSYGNVTEIVEAGKDTNQNGYVDYRKTVNEYAINTSTASLASLPARTSKYACSAGSCASPTLVTDSRYLYDDATSYSTTPTIGILTGTRVLTETGNFIDQEFDYDTSGNLTTLKQYKAVEATASFGLGTAVTTATTYDTTYHTYPLTVTNPLSQSTTTVYDYTLGLPTSVTDPNSAVTTGEYDDFGRITSVCYPGETCTTTPNLQFTYYDSHYPFYTQVTQKINSSQTFRIRKYYTGLGELLQSQVLGAEVDGISRDIVTNHLYDEFGNLIRQSVPYDVPLGSGYRTPNWGDYTAFTYDLLNRPVSTTAPNGNITWTYYYDLRMKVTDPRWKSTNSYMDPWGRTIKVTPPTGTDLEEVTYDYDILGQLTELSQDTLTTEITYDQAGRKIEMDDPDMGVWSYDYDALGNLTSQVDARNCTTTLTYDDLSRLTGKSYSGTGSCGTTASVAYTYDSGTNGTGRRTGMTDGSGSSTWAYDSRGGVTSETKVIGTESFTTSWTYNSADMVAFVTYPDSEVVEMDYNNQKAIIGMENTDATPFVYLSDVTYDAAGRLTGVDLGESGSQAIIAREFEYFPWGTSQDGGMLESLTSQQFGGSTLQNLAYDYDRNGNILEIADYVNQETASYSYDNLNRLLSAEVEDFSSTSVFEEYYEYSSAIGNLTGKGASPLSLTSYVYDVNHPHAVSDYGTTNDYEYDANGNQIVRQIGDADYNLTYDAENRLISVSSTDIPTSTATSTPTSTASSTPTNTPENSPTPSFTPSDTPVPSDTPTFAATFTPSATDENTATPSPTVISPSPVIEASAISEGGDITLTCPEGTNLLVVFYLHGRSITGVGSLSYNGTALTNKAAVDDTVRNEATAELWYLKNPDTGSSYLLDSSRSNSVSAYDRLIAIAISGADVTGDPFRNVATEIGDGDSDLGDIANSIVSSNLDLIIDGVAHFRTSTAEATTQGMIELYTGDNHGVSKINGGSSVSLSWDLNNTYLNRYAWIIASIKGQTVPTQTPTITYTPSDTPTPTATGTVYPTSTPSNTVVPSPTPTISPIQYDSVSGTYGMNGDGVTSLQWNHTAYGVYRIALVFVRTMDSRTVTATYGGTSMTPVTGLNTDQTYTFYMVDPPTGSQAVQITFDSSTKAVAAAVSYTGVDPVNPFSDTDRIGGTSITLSSSSDEWVVGAGGMDTYTNQSISPGPDQTELIELKDYKKPLNDRKIVMSVSHEVGSSSVTHSYTLIGGRDRTWGVALKPFTELTPTPTITNTPTLTYTPSSTPSPTNTGTIDPTPTPTQAGTEPAPPSLGTSQYTYDGDGNLVKSVIDSVTTYYVGRVYEKEVEGQTEIERKYYSLGRQRFAVREDSTLNWILSDHLGSTAVSANANGTWRGEIAYTPFGEMRESRGVTLTDYRYTGQRNEPEVGLHFFNARWQDPVLGRFTQADTLIPDPGNPLSLDRYAYTNYNPVKYVDPSGHLPACRVFDDVPCSRPSDYNISATAYKDEYTTDQLAQTWDYSGTGAGDWAAEHMFDYESKCFAGCTEFVSTAMTEGGGAPTSEEWNPSLDCGINNPWISTDAFYDFLVNTLGFSVLVVDNTDPNWFFRQDDIPAGSIVFYDMGNFTSKLYPGVNFSHAAITTGNTVEGFPYKDSDVNVDYSGQFGPEVADSNGFFTYSGPHLLYQTSTDPLKIVIAFKP